jgi:hypothetical protein
MEVLLTLHYIEPHRSADCHRGFQRIPRTTGLSSTDRTNSRCDLDCFIFLFYSIVPRSKGMAQ